MKCNNCSIQGGERVTLVTKMLPYRNTNPHMPYAVYCKASVTLCVWCWKDIGWDSILKQKKGTK